MRAQDIRAAIGLHRTAPDSVQHVVLEYVGTQTKNGAERRAGYARRFDAAAVVTR